MFAVIITIEDEDNIFIFPLDHLPSNDEVEGAKAGCFARLYREMVEEWGYDVSAAEDCLKLASVRILTEVRTFMRGELING